MNRYTITYYTKTGRTVVREEIISNFNIKEFNNYVLNTIKKNKTLVIKNKKKYEVIFKENIEGFEVTQY